MDLAAARQIFGDVRHPQWIEAYLMVQDNDIRGGGDHMRELYGPQAAEPDPEEEAAAEGSTEEE